jgi:hypothetical protein
MRLLGMCFSDRDVTIPSAQQGRVHPYFRRPAKEKSLG